MSRAISYGGRQPEKKEKRRKKKDVGLNRVGIDVATDPAKNGNAVWTGDPPCGQSSYLRAGVGEVKLLTILLYGDLCSWSLNTAPYVSTLLILQHTK